MVKTKKEEFIDTADKMVLPVSLITICFRIYEDYLHLIPGILIIKILVILGGSIIMIGGIIQLFLGKKVRRKGRNIQETFYLTADEVIATTYCLYFFFYIVFQWDKSSIIFTYIMLLLFGICYGYRIVSGSTFYAVKKRKKKMAG